MKKTKENQKKKVRKNKNISLSTGKPLLSSSQKALQYVYIYVVVLS